MSERPIYEIPIEPPLGGSALPMPPGHMPTAPSAYGPPPGTPSAPPVPPTLATAPPPQVQPSAPTSGAAAAGPHHGTGTHSGGPGGAPDLGFDFPFPSPDAGAVPFPGTEQAGAVPFPSTSEPPPFPFPFPAAPASDAGAVPFPGGDEPSGTVPSSLDDLLATAMREDARPSSAASFGFGTPEPAAPVAPPIVAPIVAGPIPLAAVDEAVLGTLPEALRTVDPDLIAALRAVAPSRASDLHVTAGSPPMLRVDGSLRPLDLPVWDSEKTAQALLSALTPSRRAQFEREYELDWALTLSEHERFRVNYYVQRGAIGAAFRLIPTTIKSLGELGMPDTVARFASLPRGLVLVTGPTGSGKSTTLAALIDLVNQTRPDHIVTVEDPIEYLHSSKRSLVNQREVGEDTQSFSAALKHVLRQDPDVILVGEMRDLETIAVALTAAETGHLVFATLHTQDAPQTIDRVIDVFPPHQQNQVRAQLAATLQGVVCQTLVRNASGAGRAVATEVMFMTPAIANVVREGKTYQIASMLQAGRDQGMHSMDQSLAELVNEGRITHEAALERVHDVETFSRLAKRRQGI